MKFCKNCQHHREPSVAMILTAELNPDRDFSRCGHDLALDRSVFLVTGRPDDMRRLYASTMRLNGSPCGPDGFLYLPNATPDDPAPSDFPAFGDED